MRSMRSSDQRTRPISSTAAMVNRADLQLSPWAAGARFAASKKRTLAFCQGLSVATCGNGSLSAFNTLVNVC